MVPGAMVATAARFPGRGRLGDLVTTLPPPPATPPDEPPPDPPSGRSGPATTAPGPPASGHAGGQTGGWRYPATPPPPVGSPRPPISVLWWVAGPLLAVLVGAISVVLARPAPYIALTPGSARAVEPLVTVSAPAEGPEPDIDRSAADDDGLLFVTVSVRRPSGIEALARLLDATNEIVPTKIIDGNQSEEENRTFNLQLMTNSKDKAAKVALERAGYHVKVTSTGAVVVDLIPGYPVADVLTPGDTIVDADGTAISSVDDLVSVIAGHQPGDRLSLTVESFRTDGSRKVSAEVATNPETGKAQLGVTLQNRPSYEFPFDVSIDSGDVGGPSAGLAFTLAILDRLTPGDLTGPEPVAVTGTIELDGTVGPVGGVAQKTEAAIRAGAKLFIVPVDEFADATEVARGRLEVRQVTTVDDAIAALAAVGGDPVGPVGDQSGTGG